MKLFVFLLPVLFITGCLSTAVKPETRPDAGMKEIARDDWEAYFLYSDAMNLWYSGDMERAVKKLQGIVDNGYTNETVFKTLLQFTAEFLGGENAPSRKDEPRELIRQAFGTADRALVLYPSSRDILMYSAEIYRAGGNDRLFVSTLKKMLSLNPDDIFANAYLGAYYFVNRDYRKARTHLENVVANNIASRNQELNFIYRSYYYLGMVSQMENDQKGAAEYYESARLLYNGDPNLAGNLGRAYSTLVQCEKAARVYSEIPLRDMPPEAAGLYAGSLLWLGQTNGLVKLIDEYGVDTPFLRALDYYLAGDYKRAVRDVEKARTGGPAQEFYANFLLYNLSILTGNNEKVYQTAFLLARHARQYGRPETALEYFRVLETNQKSIPHIYWLIGSALDDMGKDSDAIAYYNRFIDGVNSGTNSGDKDNLVTAYLRLSYLYSQDKKTNDHLKALQTAKDLAKTDEDIFQVYYYSGLISYEETNYRTAIADFSRAMSVDSRNPVVHYFIAASHASLDERKTAIGVLEKAADQVTPSPEMENLLAYLYALENVKLDEAVLLVNRSLAREPENVAYLDTLGWIYYQKGELDRALAIFTKVLFLIDKNPEQYGLDEVYYHIGMLYHRLKKPEDAERYFQKGREKNPDAVFWKNLPR